MASPHPDFSLNTKQARCESAFEDILTYESHDPKTRASEHIFKGQIKIMKATLIRIEGETQRIQLNRPVNILGRSAGCDIQIDHESLSRRHAILVVTDGLVVVRDMITTNGTRVNGQRIKWAALMPNDRISFGSVRYRIELAPDSDFSPITKPDSSKGQSMTELFGSPESTSTDPLNSACKEPENQGTDDNQNTEIGGWRPIA
ncbi:MAG: FHA domain-containing protein [Planctomycetota bacterium]|nr:FHA domain-containing protein [Planctomycetota bacterium]